MPLLSGYACKACLQCLPRFHYSRLAFCFLPLAAILESLCFVFLIIVYTLSSTKLEIRAEQILPGSEGGRGKVG
jgi:hypothetical protein